MNPRFDNWLWLCPAVAIALAAVILWWWGLSWTGALLAAIVLACPVLLLWGAWQALRSRAPLPGEGPRERK